MVTKLPGFNTYSYFNTSMWGVLQNVVWITKVSRILDKSRC